MTCKDVPVPGGFRQLRDDGNACEWRRADIWSDGGSGNTIYGAAVASETAILDYQDPYPGNPA